MKTNKFADNFLKNKYAFLAAGCTVVVMLFVYLANVVYPFGSDTVMVVDLYHQYAPLYAEFWDKVMNGGSFLFSWESAGGVAWIGNFFNYLSSPFTFLTLLFPRENITEAIALIILLKCALASFTFSVFINKKTENKNCLISAFGVLYACCGWFVAYFWDVMWLDGFYLLPLVIMGIEKIIDEKHSALYIITLASTIITSYYMAYMICIFSVAYFIYYVFSTNNKIFDKNIFKSFKVLRENVFINRGFNFAFSSFGAVLLCAIALVPLIYSLGTSSATKDAFPEEFTTYFNIFDFLIQHFTGVEATIRCSKVDMYLPNISCGVLTILLIPLFFLTKTITRKEKTLSAGLIVFLASGFYINYLDFIWHGFHFPNDLPYRFSFLYSFVLLLVAFKGLSRIKEIPVKYIKYTAISVGLLLLIAQKIKSENFNEGAFWVSLAFVAIYAFGLLLLKNESYTKKTIVILLLILVCTEYTIGNSTKYIIDISRDDYVYDYEGFRELKDQLDDEEDSFYRLEMLKSDISMSPCWYGYNGVNYFSSMADEIYTRFQAGLGMESNNINSCAYNSQTPIYNALFGIKYVFINPMNTSQFVPREYFKYKTQNIDFLLYENLYSLPLAFAVNEDVENYKISGNNPFKNQGEIFADATGVKKVFRNMEIYRVEADNIEINEEELIKENCTEYSAKYLGKASIKVCLKAKSSGEAFLYAVSKSGTVELADIENDGKLTVQEIGVSPYITSVGKVEKNDKLEVTLKIPYDEETKELVDDTLYIYGAVVDKASFEKGYEKLQTSPLNITEFEDTHFSGKITMPEDSILYTSVPYDKGWHIKVDGNSADDQIVKIGDALIGVDLDAGEHNIEFTYSAPGLYEGAVISALTIVVLLILFIIKNKKK